MKHFLQTPHAPHKHARALHNESKIPCYVGAFTHPDNPQQILTLVPTHRFSGVLLPELRVSADARITTMPETLARRAYARFGLHLVEKSVQIAPFYTQNGPAADRITDARLSFIPMTAVVSEVPPVINGEKSLQYEEVAVLQQRLDDTYADLTRRGEFVPLWVGRTAEVLGITMAMVKHTQALR